MARLTAPARDDLPEEERAVYDSIVQTRGRVMGPFSVLVHCPPVGGRIADVGTYVRFESPLPPDVRALAALLVARAFDCRFEWAGWSGHARDAGIDEESIAAIREGKEPAGLSSEQQLVHRFGTQLLGADHRVDDETYAAVVEHFGERGAVDLSATFGYFAMLTFPLNAFEVDVPEGKDVLPLQR